MELHARAGGLRRNRVRMGGQPFRAVDVDVQVLTARGKNLLVDQPVARVRAQRLAGEVVGCQGRQHPDHDDVRADRAGLLLGGVEACPQLGLELLSRPANKAARPDVDLDVELPELGLKGGICDSGKDLRVAHSRVLALVHQVEFDFQAGERAFEVELRLAQHPREYLEGLAQLRAIALPVLTTEVPALDLRAHRPTSGCVVETRSAALYITPLEPISHHSNAERLIGRRRGLHPADHTRQLLAVAGRPRPQPRRSGGYFSEALVDNEYGARGVCDHVGGHAAQQVSHDAPPPVGADDDEAYLALDGDVD